MDGLSQPEANSSGNSSNSGGIRVASSSGSVGGRDRQYIGGISVDLNLMLSLSMSIV
jgi:hypothetical protein